MSQQIRFIIIMISLLFIPAAKSNPFDEGKVKGVSFQHSFSNMTPIEIASWTWNHDSPGSKFYRIEYAIEMDNQTPIFELNIFGKTGKLLNSISKSSIRSGIFTWSDIVSTDSPVLRINSFGQELPSLVIKIRSIIYQTTSGDSFNLTHPDEREDILLFTNQLPELYELGQAIVKLIYVEGSFSKTCTGFLVSDELVITNHHCMPSQEVCITTEVRFDYRYFATGTEDTGYSDRCKEIVTKNKTMDYALFRLSNSVLPSTRSFVDFSTSQEAVDSEQLFVLQHPQGEPLQVSRLRCSVTSPPTESSCSENAIDAFCTRHSFGHKCDTLKGSSGSPIFNTEYKLVGLHYAGFDRNNPRWQDENRAVPTLQIWNEIEAHLMN